MADANLFASHEEWMRAEYEEALKNGILECAVHGIFESEVGPDCPICAQPMLQADTWRGD